METVCSFLVYLIKQPRREQKSNCVADQGSPSRDNKDFELLSITYLYLSLSACTSSRTSAFSGKDFVLFSITRHYSASLVINSHFLMLMAPYPSRDSIGERETAGAKPCPWLNASDFGLKWCVRSLGCTVFSWKLPHSIQQVVRNVRCFRDKRAACPLDSSTSSLSYLPCPVAFLSIVCWSRLFAWKCQRYCRRRRGVHVYQTFF